MPLTPPVLDDRRFEDLMTEARARIARSNRAWTDFNDSDPGVTLVQLFAWLTELTLYRMNQVPQRNYVKFLQMLGLQVRPAQPARATLVFTPDGAPDGGVLSVPKGTQVSADAPDGGPPIVFETAEGFDVVARPLGSVQVFDGRFTEVGPLNDPAQGVFRPFGRAPAAGNALYLGFDPSPTQLRAFLAGEASRRIERFRPFPSELRLQVFLPSPESGPVGSCDLETEDNTAQPAPPPGVRLTWEYKPDPVLPWQRLSLVRDATAGFTREGLIIVEAPAETITPTLNGQPTPAAESLRDVLVPPERPLPRFWLRCRLDDGAYPDGLAPAVDFVRVNAVDAENLATVLDERLGVSDGRPGQAFTLADHPVRADESLRVTVGPADDPGVVWRWSDDLLAAGPDSEQFAFDRTTGVIRFGDGARGAIPAAGSEVVARSYRHGGGAAGNVAAGALATPRRDLGPVTVTNPRPAVGGRDEQSVDDLVETAPARVRARNRAVTTADFVSLASSVGGVARAACLPRAHAKFRGEFAGAVTVVVAPDEESLTPIPTEAQVREVCRQLNRYRLVGTEVFVTAPKYVPVQVRALVKSRAGVAPSDVERQVTRALNEYLDPLGRQWPAGGPRLPSGARGRGGSSIDWQNEQFGQEFQPSRVYGVILKVAGVSSVPLLSVVVDGNPLPEGDRPFEPGPDALYYPAGHEIRVTPDARG